MLPGLSQRVSFSYDACISNENSVQELLYQVTLLLNWESSTGLLLEVVIDCVDKYRLIQGKFYQDKLPMLNFSSIGRKSEHRKLI